MTFILKANKLIYNKFCVDIIKKYGYINGYPPTTYPHGRSRFLLLIKCIESYTMRGGEIIIKWRTYNAFLGWGLI